MEARGGVGGAGRGLGRRHVRRKGTGGLHGRAVTRAHCGAIPGRGRRANTSTKLGTDLQGELLKISVRVYILVRHTTYVGRYVGVSVGTCVGRGVGRKVGCLVGYGEGRVGSGTGRMVGAGAGWLVGLRVGCLVGLPVPSVGSSVGLGTGCFVGAGIGAFVGKCTCRFKKEHQTPPNHCAARRGQSSKAMH